jgi:hypothetical protein
MDLLVESRNYQSDPIPTLAQLREGAHCASRGDLAKQNEPEKKGPADKPADPYSRQPPQWVKRFLSGYC